MIEDWELMNIGYWADRITNFGELVDFCNGLKMNAKFYYESYTITVSHDYDLSYFKRTAPEPSKVMKNILRQLCQKTIRMEHFYK